MTDKIISFKERARQIKQSAERPFDLKAELNYRTEKLLEIIDDHNRRLDRLEANLKSLIRIIKNSLKDK